MEKEIKDSLQKLRHRVLTEDMTQEELDILKDRIALYEKIDDKIGINVTTKIDINTLLSIGGTLACILLIMGYEKTNLFTTKAFSFIPKIGK